MEEDVLIHVLVVVTHALIVVLAVEVVVLENVAHHVLVDVKVHLINLVRIDVMDHVI